ncbi:helix-turn-helix transcriptional regulator [Criibacterium bergeronii]|uniref:Helix-turn-helix transcriptional regulator n=1 Tax=Criibacterium bergeronii TaxID=1871336 RepID=A0A552UXF9_9FIRM|nr:helix-turn-helix domain-containing protein [Criibacterium bergeronii]TRW22895.1 helix-turn-helix transcriptional regulator [Criibacterium bergeronii]
MEKASIIIKKILVEKNMKQNEVSNYLGISPQNFANKLSRNTFSFDDFSKILDFLGYEIEIIKKSEN